MRKLHVSNIPQETTEASLRAMFSTFGHVRSIKVATDIFTGKCRGAAFIEMETPDAWAAIAVLDGKRLADSGNPLRVRFEHTFGPRGFKRR
jgi:RNA recognition motif-containing protein